jgi:hypothetical protein
LCGNKKTTGDYEDSFKLKFSKIRESEGSRFIQGVIIGYDAVQLPRWLHTFQRKLLSLPLEKKNIHFSLAGAGGSFVRNVVTRLPDNMAQTFRRLKYENSVTYRGKITWLREIFVTIINFVRIPF